MLKLDPSFFEEHYLRLPFSVPGGAKDIVAPALETLLNQDADVLRAEDGTVRVRNAQEHDGKLKTLAESFHETLRAPINIHLYSTPADGQGFGWHYDVEEVFIIQCRGVKEFHLRKNSVNPWPVLETMPSNLEFEREVLPVMRCRLEAGDWLYIPSGYWHAANAETESVTIAVGVMEPTALDAFDELRKVLLTSVAWRQRLAKNSDIQSIFAELGKDLSRELQHMDIREKLGR